MDTQPVDFTLIEAFEEFTPVEIALYASKLNSMIRDVYLLQGIPIDQKQLDFNRRVINALEDLAQAQQA